MSKNAIKLSFFEVQEMKGIKVSSIIGIYEHCIAVTKDNKVFVFGNWFYSDGKLGLEYNVKSTSKFTEILSLRQCRIVSSYAGSFHSIFKSFNRNLFGCGDNTHGSLSIEDRLGQSIQYTTLITANKASFWVAGFNSTTVFSIHYPEMNPNKNVTSMCPNFHLQN